MGATASDTRTDEQLVADALGGDRDAFGCIYDRYAPTVYSMCSNMLSSRDDAEDVTADVFLVAAERLAQLRDPSRLRWWLMSIARRKVYRRSDARSRVAPVAEVDTVTDTLVTDDAASDELEDADLVRAVQEAADGLDDGDRMVLELTLQGCEGAELAEVLGVAPNTASQAASRMRDRLERSIGALFVARQGRAECTDLDGVLADWDGTFSVLWRKRVARHVDGCTTCGSRARKVPALLLEGLAGAAPAVVVPVGIRHRVVDGARIGGTTHAPWSDSGFPPADGRSGRWRRAVLAAAAVLAVLVVVGVVALAGGDPPPSTTTSTTTKQLPVPSAPVPSSVPPATTAPAPLVPGGQTSDAPSSVPTDPTAVEPPAPIGGGDPGRGGDPGGGSGGGTDGAPTGGGDTVPPTRPTRPVGPTDTRPPAVTGGGSIVSLPPRVPIAPRSPLDPRGGSGGPVIG